MFDGIGRSLDPDAPRRRALATGIASLLVGGGAAFALAVGAWTVHEAVTAPTIDDEDLVMVELDEPPLDVVVPEAPRLGGGKQARQGSDTVRPEPDAPPEIAPELDDTPEVTRPLEDSVRAGEDGGHGDDDVSIDAPPCVGDPRSCSPDGELGGEGTAGRSVVHHTEVTVRRRIAPEHPTDDLATHTCVVTVDIGALGRPDAVRVESCDPVYAIEARRSMLKWRWAKRDAGKRTRYRLVFKGR